MITVHDRELCSQLLGIEILEATPKEQTSTPNVRMVTPLGINQSHSQIIRAQEWLSRKARRNIISLPDDPEVLQVKEICKKLHQGQKDLLQEVDEFIVTESHSKRRKKEMLYQKWTKQVFEPLQVSLSQTLKQILQYNEIQKRQLFDQYIKLRNNKDVFLDIIDINEYNPLRLHYITMTAQTSKLNDPLLVQQRNHQEEVEVTEKDRHTPLGREDTNAVLWLAMELIQIDSDIRYRSRLKVQEKETCSHIEGGTVIESVAIDQEPHLPHKRLIKYPPKEEITLKWEHNIT